eukprot:6112773-Prymnesium_polylepis.1
MRSARDTPPARGAPSPPPSPRGADPPTARAGCAGPRARAGGHQGLGGGRRQGGPDAQLRGGVDRAAQPQGGRRAAALV